MKNINPRLVVTVLMLISFYLANCQTNVIETIANDDEKLILENFRIQEECWNQKDLVCYMKAYSKEDTIQTVSRNGAIFGYDSILKIYKKYFTKDRMGHLNFNSSHFRKLSEELYFVTGRFTLQLDGQAEQFSSVSR